MSFALALVLKPLALIALFGSARLIAWAVFRLMPDSRLKRALFFDDGGRL